MAEKAQRQRQPVFNAYVLIAAFSRRRALFHRGTFDDVVRVFHGYDRRFARARDLGDLLFFRFHTVQYVVGAFDLGRADRGHRSRVYTRL